MSGRGRSVRDRGDTFTPPQHVTRLAILEYALHVLGRRSLRQLRVRPEILLHATSIRSDEPARRLRPPDEIDVLSGGGGRSTVVGPAPHDDQSVVSGRRPDRVRGTRMSVTLRGLER